MSTKHDPASETLADVVIRDGRLMKKFVDRHGNETFAPIEEENEDPFAGTETVPSDWTTSEDTDPVLIPKEALTRAEHTDRSLKVEATLIKALSPRVGRRGGTETIDTNGNTALRDVLIDLCKAMGGEWADRAKHII